MFYPDGKPYIPAVPITVRKIPESQQSQLPVHQLPSPLVPVEEKKIASSSSAPSSHDGQVRVTEPDVTEDFVFLCPWCKQMADVPRDRLNCKIFRHGLHVGTFQPINPHASQDECERLLREGQIFEGCGKPFSFDGQVAKKCDYALGAL